MKFPPLPAFVARLTGAGRTSPIGPIGLEVGSTGLHLLQFERMGEELGIRAHASVPLEGEAEAQKPGELRRRLKEALASAPFSGKRVVTAMPPGHVKLMVLNYELADAEAEPQLILDLVAERTQASVDGCVVDYLPIRGTEGKPEDKSAIVALADEADVIEYLELLRGAGLEVEALEVVPVALRRLMTWPPTLNRGENFVVLYCGWERSHLIVLWGRRLILYREVAFCEREAIARLADVLSLPERSAASLVTRYGVRPPDADESASVDIARTIVQVLKPDFDQIADEVTKALIYTESRTRGESIDQVLISGALNRWPGIAELLGELVSSQVDVLVPLANVATRAGSAPAESRFGLEVAAGLALRGIDTDG